MWKLEQEEYYFRVFDQRRQIAAYFDPDYGGALPAEGQDEAVEAIWKRREPILGGYLMMGLAKLGVYGADEPVALAALDASLEAARGRIRAWREALADVGVLPSSSYVGVSHTDQDMLTVSFPVAFPGPVPLCEKDVAAALSPILDRLQRLSLL